MIPMLKTTESILHSIRKHVVSINAVWRHHFPNIIDDDGNLMSEKDVAAMITKDLMSDLDRFDKEGLINGVIFPDQKEVESFLKNVKDHIVDIDGVMVMKEMC